MQVNKNRTIRKQYLVCHESTKKSPGMEKVKTRKSVAVLDEQGNEPEEGGGK